MIKLKVYGRLRKFLGKAEFEINAATPKEVFSFLLNSFDGIQEHIEKQEYCIMAGNINVTEDLIDLKLKDEIKIIPVVHRDILFLCAGAGAKFAGATISAMSGAIATFVGGALTSIGINMLIGGVTNMLFPPPKPPSNKSQEQDPSFIFNGTANISKQGVPINILYGELLIGSNTISANIDTHQKQNNDND